MEDVVETKNPPSNQEDQKKNENSDVSKQGSKNLKRRRQNLKRKLRKRMNPLSNLILETFMPESQSEMTAGDDTGLDDKVMTADGA